jgi:hypothetical protein
MYIHVYVYMKMLLILFQIIVCVDNTIIAAALDIHNNH